MQQKLQTNFNHTLSHTTWNCKYHIVFAPKYRRKIFYNDKKLEIGQILRELCDWKGVNLITAEACPAQTLSMEIKGKRCHAKYVKKRKLLR